MKRSKKMRILEKNITRTFEDNNTLRHYLSNKIHKQIEAKQQEVIEKYKRLNAKIEPFGAIFPRLPMNQQDLRDGLSNYESNLSYHSHQMRSLEVPEVLVLSKKLSTQVIHEEEEEPYNFIKDKSQSTSSLRQLNTTEEFEPKTAYNDENIGRKQMIILEDDDLSADQSIFTHYDAVNQPSQVTFNCKVKSKKISVVRLRKSSVDTSGIPMSTGRKLINQLILDSNQFNQRNQSHHTNSGKAVKPHLNTRVNFKQQSPESSSHNLTRKLSDPKITNKLFLIQRHNEGTGNLNVIGKSRKSMIERISNINKDLVVTQDEEQFMVQDRMKPVLPILNRRKRTLINILRTARENVIEPQVKQDIELKVPDLQITNQQQAEPLYPPSPKKNLLEQFIPRIRHKKTQRQEMQERFQRIMNFDKELGEMSSRIIISSTYNLHDSILKNSRNIYHSREQQSDGGNYNRVVKFDLTNIE
ncbi:hypothetical protein FGO68_gene3928 [Halteria grandinella]|uniref:Uncharacterized protein n=1 Tax=Halteria grandinella TaxID=5974 RepID=A0A8J8NE00_HALGN|nr:hypothetical protein FGO68_gene3928 [Halteria grandinella]